MKPEYLQREQWHQGQLLAFSALDGVTDYERGLVARTVTRPDGVEICLPEKCLLRFPNTPRGPVCFGGDFFSFANESGRITRGVFADAHHLLLEGDCMVPRDLQKLAGVSGGGRVLVGCKEQFNRELLGLDFDTLWRERSRWLFGRKIPELSPSASRTVARVLTVMKAQVCSPEGEIRRRWTTPDRWPHRDMWLWDTAFHAIGWRHVDAPLAMEMLDAMLDSQRADGFLTYRCSPAGAAAYLGGEATQPPVLALAAELVFEKSRDRAWLEKIYPRLAAYVEWDLRHRDADGDGLPEWFLEDDPRCRSSESGQDNSPRFDDNQRLGAVDFASFLARECEALAALAAHLNRAADGEVWRVRRDVLCRAIREKCWSGENGFFFDYDARAGAPSQVWTNAGFMPLLCGAADSEQAGRLAEKLASSAHFGTPLPVPTVAALDRAHYAKDMWRGPVWVNMNWLIAAGFARYGMAAEAAFIRDATVSEIERCCEKFGTLFEYYDDRREVEPPFLFRKGELTPKNPYRQVIHDYGWTTTLYMDFINSR